jgi:hypothetical protein
MGALRKSPRRLRGLAIVNHENSHCPVNCGEMRVCGGIMDQKWGANFAMMSLGFQAQSTPTSAPEQSAPTIPVSFALLG